MPLALTHPADELQYVLEDAGVTNVCASVMQACFAAVFACIMSCLKSGVLYR